MHREFLDLYNRELQLLYEQARDFASEYPGIAERLGGLIADRMDPMVAGLLEGAAFLAARVQLKMKHEFPEFTSNLLEQLVPGYLAPTPSVMLVRFLPPYSDPALREGYSISMGCYLDATYRERDRQVSCRYQLRSKVTMWPFEISAADYLPSATGLQALGLNVGSDVLAGLKISLTCRMAARPDDEIPYEEALKLPGTWFAGCRVTDLTFHLLGNEADAIALYEQLVARCVKICFRYFDEFGDPVFIPIALDSLEQVGFDEDSALLNTDARIFTGFNLLREYFVFPRKFLAFKLTNLAEAVAQLPAKSVDILFAFDQVNARLSAAVSPSTFSLYTAPAVNLFEKTADRIAIKNNQHEYHLIPDRSRYLDYEPHRVLEVYAHTLGGQEKMPVRPLYSAGLDAASSAGGLAYTIRRVPRRRTVEEQRQGVQSDYTGTDMFISLGDQSLIDDDSGIAELSVRALCSNRHLTEHLPIGSGGADFRLLEDATVDIRCVEGPTKPQEPLTKELRGRGEHASTGTVTWRLVNMLALNHLGLIEKGAGKSGQALREVLAIFGDLADNATERRIRGIRNVDARPVIKRVKQPGGVGVARGTQITVMLDEKAFEGSGIFLLGAVLDRFFAEYAGFNHFTQTVISTVERGEVMKWPPRIGMRRSL